MPAWARGPHMPRGLEPVSQIKPNKIVSLVEADGLHGTTIRFGLLTERLLVLFKLSVT